MTGKTPPTMSVEEVAIDDLLPDPANPRRISDAQLEALTGSLKEYGFVQPVLARHEDKTVIGGHQRLTAARRLGYKTVPVTYLDLTTEQARVLNLGLNKISGEWDQELLARLLADLKPVEEIDLALTGFSKDELAKLLKSLDVRDKKDRLEDFDLEAAEEAARAAPRAKPGEIWVLATTASCAAIQRTSRTWTSSLMVKRRLRFSPPTRRTWWTTRPTTTRSRSRAAGARPKTDIGTTTTTQKRQSSSSANSSQWVCLTSSPTLRFTSGTLTSAGSWSSRPGLRLAS